MKNLNTQIEEANLNFLFHFLFSLCCWLKYQSDEPFWEGIFSNLTESNYSVALDLFGMTLFNEHNKEVEIGEL